MTPFAQLHSADALEKSAMTALKSLHGLMRNGIWKTVARRTNPGQTGMRGVAGKVSRWFHNPNVGEIGADGLREGASTALSKGLTAYGLGGMGLGFAGYNLPGSNLAMNLTMPGVGALFSAPGYVQAGRMASKANQNALKEDALIGARQAGADMISMLGADHRYGTNPGFYGKFLEQASPEIAGIASRYSTGSVKPMSTWQTLAGLAENPQEVINNRMDQTISGLLSKSGAEKRAFGAAARAVGKGFGHAFPWLFPVAGVGMLGHAVLDKKPYDEQQVQQRGYAGAAAAAQKAMGNMSWLERTALQIDPTLAAKKMETYLPGTIAQWEKNTGQTFRPGMLSKTVDNWTNGGDHRYYEFDAAGTRHYI